MECEECEEHVDEVRLNTLVDCYSCPARLCTECAYNHFIRHQLGHISSDV